MQNVQNVLKTYIRKGHTEEKRLNFGGYYGIKYNPEDNKISPDIR